MNENIPIQTIKLKGSTVSWFNETIKRLMEKRNIFYKWWKINRSHCSSRVLYNSYKESNKLVNYEINKVKKGCLLDHYKNATSIRDKWKII